MMSTRFGRALSPFDAVARELDRWFDQTLGNGTQGRTVTAATVAPVSLWDNEQHVYLEVDVPGFTQEELDLTLEEGRLYIRGERKAPQYEGKCWYDERRYGRFERVVSLSDMVDPDAIEAELSDGVLRLKLAKRPEHQPHRIAINAGSSQPRRLETEAATGE